MSQTTRTEADSAELGARLAEARREARLPQMALADEVGVRLWVIQEYEAGKQAIPLDHLDRFAKLTGRPIGWFLGDWKGSDSPTMLDREAQALLERDVQLTRREAELAAQLEAVAQREQALLQAARRAAILIADAERNRARVAADAERLEPRLAELADEEWKAAERAQALAAREAALPRVESALSEAQALADERAALQRAEASRLAGLGEQEHALQQRAQELERDRREADARAATLTQSERRAPLTEREAAATAREAALARAEAAVGGRESEIERREREAAAAEQRQRSESTRLERQAAWAERRETDLQRLRASLPLQAGSANWDVEALGLLAEARAHEFPDRIDEWRAYVERLRELVDLDGVLPPALDSVVWEVFEPLLERPRRPL